MQITATVVDSAMLQWWLRGFGEAVEISENSGQIVMWAFMPKFLKRSALQRIVQLNGSLFAQPLRG